MSKKLLPALLCVAVFVACKDSGAPLKKGRIIACSIFPVCDIVKNVAGNRADVFFIIPAGANPHTFEMLQSIIKKIQQADMYIGVNPGFDGWAALYLNEKASAMYLQRDNDNAHARDHHAAHDHEVNPHIWLSAGGAATIARAAAAYLAGIDPDGARVYSENAAAYEKELAALDGAMKRLFGGVKNRRFIQWHPAWDYLAAECGLEIAGTIQKGHGDTPSVREFKELVEKARSRGVKVVVVEFNIRNREADALAAEIGAGVVGLDTIGNPAIDEKSSYIKMMMHNAELLSQALKR